MNAGVQRFLLTNPPVAAPTLWWDRAPQFDPFGNAFTEAVPFAASLVPPADPVLVPGREFDVTNLAEWNFRLNDPVNSLPGSHIRVLGTGWTGDTYLNDNGDQLIEFMDAGFAIDGAFSINSVGVPVQRVRVQANAALAAADWPTLHNGSSLIGGDFSAGTSDIVFEHVKMGSGFVWYGQQWVRMALNQCSIFSAVGFSPFSSTHGPYYILDCDILVDDGFGGAQCVNWGPNGLNSVMWRSFLETTGVQPADVCWNLDGEGSRAAFCNNEVRGGKPFRMGNFTTNMEHYVLGNILRDAADDPVKASNPEVLHYLNNLSARDLTDWQAVMGAPTTETWVDYAGGAWNTNSWGGSSTPSAWRYGDPSLIPR